MPPFKKEHGELRITQAQVRNLTVNLKPLFGPGKPLANLSRRINPRNPLLSVYFPVNQLPMS